MSDRERGLRDYEKTCMDISTRIWLNRGTLGRIVRLYDYKASKFGIYFVSLLGLNLSEQKPEFNFTSGPPL